MRCKNWIFDMDGTLTDSMGVVWKSAPLAMLAHFGREPEPNLAEKLAPMSMYDAAHYLIKAYDLPLDETNFEKTLRAVAAELYQKVELKPGVQELLNHLQAEGARMCICSNTWEDQCRTVLNRLGVGGYFDFYIWAKGSMSKEKPDVFFEAARRMGAEDPSDVTVCEDSLYAAATAHEAGFRVIGVADWYSRFDEAELQAICSPFVHSWTELDWDIL